MLMQATAGASFPGFPCIKMWESLESVDVTDM